MNYSINIDWLQLFCKCENFSNSALKFGYSAILQEYQSRHFKEIWFIYLNDEKIGELQNKPHSNIINSGNCVLKIENKCLYQLHLKSWVTTLLEVLKLEFVSISRIDISCDFNEFENNYQCEQLIHDFVSGRICKHGKNKFKLQGSHTNILNYDYIKFGSNTSEITYYLYNKSKELAEMKNKPWIVDTWNLNNIDTTRDVWRLEFSIKKLSKSVVDVDTGEVIDNKSLEILEPEKYCNVFKFIISKYWKFSRADHYNRLVDKDKCPKIKYFDFINNSCKLLRISEKKSSNRMDKVFLKKLLSLDEETKGNVFFNLNFIPQIEHYYRRSRGLMLYNN